MNWYATVPVSRCPNCMSYPRLRSKHLFSSRYRLTCKCGVAGSWAKIGREASTFSQIYNRAAVGWEIVAGHGPGKWPPDDCPPPHPREK